MTPTSARRVPARTTMIGLWFAWLSMAGATFGLLLATHALWVDFTSSEGFSYKMPSVVLVIALVMAVVSVRLIPRSNARHWIAVCAITVASICLGAPLLFVGWYAGGMSVGG